MPFWHERQCQNFPNSALYCVSPPSGLSFCRLVGLTLGRQVEIEQSPLPWAKMLLVLASWPSAGAVVAFSKNYTTIAQVLFWLAFTMFVARGILEIRGKRLRE